MLHIWLIMSVNGMRQVVEKVGSSTVDHSICLVDLKINGQKDEIKGLDKGH